MFSDEIENVMKNIPCFLGVFSRDNLPQPTSYPFCLITNTDLQTESGTHWLAIFVDRDGRGMYFDSYAMKPYYQEFEDYLNTYCKNGYDWNKARLQCTTCTTCGEYCCCYLILRTAGFSHNQFLGFFGDNQVSNDTIVKELFNVVKK